MARNIDDGNFYVCAMHGKVPYNEKLLCFCGRIIYPIYPVAKKQLLDVKSPRVYQHSKKINKFYKIHIKICLE